ncbi:MAG TPA: hypothetical protein VK196_10425 [Magnetospirillum sp.]|nr:hypothetical protein [Magnetospirillum sp.]
MTTRVVGLVAAVISAAIPLVSAWAQVEHAQRLALEVAVRRAQVRALLCEPQKSHSTTPGASMVPDARLPSSPPVGTAGPVAAGDCSNSLWPFGR